MTAVECTLSRQSWGTQYSKPPSVLYPTILVGLCTKTRMRWVTRGRWDRRMWKWAQYTGSVVIRPRNDVLGVGNRPDRVSMHPERLASCSMSRSIPGSDGSVIGSRDNMPPIGRVSNRQHPVSMPLKGITNWSASLSIPDSNGVVARSGDDVLAIGRVSNGPHPVSVPLEGIAD